MNSMTNHNDGACHSEAAHSQKMDHDHSCCSTPAKHESSPSPHAAHANHAHGTGWKAASSVTLHCLTGCAVGEWIGLAIGVGLGLPAVTTIVLAVVLSFISGFALTLVPLIKGGMGFNQAMKIVWVGEVISISVMELVMNLVDYHMGGMRAVSLASAQYWSAFGSALVAGYVAAIPVNYWLLQRNLKNCH